jgi:hypothetical protein
MINVPPTVSGCAKLLNSYSPCASLRHRRQLVAAAVEQAQRDIAEARLARVAHTVVVGVVPHHEAENDARHEAKVKRQRLLAKVGRRRRNLVRAADERRVASRSCRCRCRWPRRLERRQRILVGRNADQVRGLLREAARRTRTCRRRSSRRSAARHVGRRHVRQLEHARSAMPTARCASCWPSASASSQTKSPIVEVVHEAKVEREVLDAKRRRNVKSIWKRACRRSTARVRVDRRRTRPARSPASA